MRILWQSFVDVAENARYFERLSQYLNKIAAPGTTLDVVGMSPPDRDFGRLTEFRCGVMAIERCIEAEEKGYDAFVFGHFQEPGLYEARSAVRIPVVGTGESTLHYAAQLGRRIALVSIDPIFETFHLEQIERHGLGQRVHSVTGLGFLPQDFEAAFGGDRAAFARLLAVLEAKTKPLVDAGADVVVPAGVLPGLLFGGERGLKIGHAPVVNCAAVALKSAEMNVALRELTGIEPSRGPSFALASKRAIDDFRGLIAKGASA